MYKSLILPSLLFGAILSGCMDRVARPKISSSTGAMGSDNSQAQTENIDNSDQQVVPKPVSGEGQETLPNPTSVVIPAPKVLPPDDYLALKCKPRFDPADTVIGAWVSGDGGRSVRVSPTRTVWMFSDTWLGSAGERRTGANLVGNTVATSDCNSDNKFAVNYYWRFESYGNSAFFPDQAGGRFWLLAPFFSGSNLYQTLQKIVPDGDGGAFGFKSTGITLSRIANPKENPSSWKFKLVPLIETEAGVPGSDAVVLNGYVHLYSVFEGNVHITRVQEDALNKTDDARDLLEYLNKSGEWKKGYNIPDAKILGMRANSGMTVRKNGTKWQMIYMDTTSFPFSEVRMALSDKLEGPWGESRLIYTTPEVKSVKDAFCYTAYEQPDYASDAGRKIAFTYSCNTLGSNPPAEIYTPHLVEVDNPFPPAIFGR